MAKADKWKSKRWYRVFAPPMFQGKEIGETAASDPKLLIGRVLPVNYGMFTGNLTQNAVYTKLKFRITEVEGEAAKTEYIGHRLSDAYLKTVARRRRSVIHSVFDVKTADGRQVRIWVITVTAHRVSGSQEKAIRKIVEEKTQEKAKALSYYEFCKAALEEKLAAELQAAAKKIAPIRRVEIKKTELRE